MSTTELVYNETLIHARNEMLSLTDMWRAAGKPPGKDSPQWRRLPGSSEFIEHIASIMGLSHDELFQVVRGGSEPATWAHWQIALAYAKYLSPEFHAWCNEVVRAHMEGQRLPASVTTPLTAEIFRRELLPVRHDISRLSAGQDELRIEVTAIGGHVEKISGEVVKLGSRIDDIVPRRWFAEWIRDCYTQVILIRNSGFCPSCPGEPRTRIVCDDGTRTDAFQIDHFRGRERVGVDDGWPVCDRCNLRLDKDVEFKKSRQSPFEVFHYNRLALLGNHKKNDVRQRSLL